MNIVYTAQIIGIVSVFLLFCLKLYIISTPQAWVKSGRAADLWTSIYVFFLFALRAIQFTGLTTTDELRIISGFTAVIPLAGVIAHLFLLKQTPDLDIQGQMDQANQLLSEAKSIKREAQQVLESVKQK